MFKEPEEMSSGEQWTIAFTVVFGAFMAVMDTSVVNVAMSHMMGSFATNLSSITWVATSYSIAEIIMVTMAGWWSSLIGRKNLYVWSFVLFTIGSILCGTATSFNQMIFYRIIQGIGGGALIPVSQAILRETFPASKQGMAMAVFGMGVVLAPALGPICGGWLTDRWGWPWVFYINLPVCVAGIILTIKFVHDPPYLKRGVKSIDWIGILLLSIFLTGMQIVLERGQEDNWFDSNFILVTTIITCVSMLGMIFWELYHDEPVVNLRVLKDKNLSLGFVMGLIFGVSLFGTTFVLPQFTQDLLGYPAFESGLALAPRALTLMFFMPIVGWLYPRYGARVLVLCGIFIIMYSYYDLGQLNTNAGIGDLIMPLLIMGVGMPFMFIPLSTVSLCSVDRSNMTDASSLYTLSRRVGGNIGYALVAVILDRRVQMHRAYLSEHISNFSDISRQTLQQIQGMLHHLGYSILDSTHLAIGVLEKSLVKQATMLAYNDISIIFGLFFLLLIPLVFMMPSKKKLDELTKDKPKKK
jgi:DHA2 family multidrug resistance protein